MIETKAETRSDAWMNRVLDEHRQLRLMIAELREFLQQPRPSIGARGAHTWASALAQWLVKLHDSLFRHFRYEEESGMAEDITLRHPRRSSEIERLMGEHGAILAQLRTMMSEALDYSEGHVLDNPALRTRLQAVLDALDQHERAETDLVQRAELQEVGVGD